MLAKLLRSRVPPLRLQSLGTTPGYQELKMGGVLVQALLAVEWTLFRACGCKVACAELRKLVQNSARPTGCFAP